MNTFTKVKMHLHLSNEIDEEYSNLKKSFEADQNESIKEEKYLALKKAFINLQEEKVKLMGEDLELEKQQTNSEQEQTNIQTELEKLNMKDENLMEKWNRSFLAFEKLKTKKEVVVNEDSKLEDLSKTLKEKFDVNRKLSVNSNSWCSIDNILKFISINLALFLNTI